MKPLMKQDFLFKICLIISLTGILLLIFLANNLEPPLMPIKDVYAMEIDSFVKVEGNVTSLIQLEYLFIMNVMDGSSEIKVIGYEDNETKISLNKGDQVEVIGKVKEYEREMEIEASRIKLID